VKKVRYFQRRRFNEEGTENYERTPIWSAQCRLTSRKSKQKKAPTISRQGFFFTNLAPRPGLEPGTCGLTVRRSTN
jgi:hypothetical protein